MFKQMFSFSLQFHAKLTLLSFPALFFMPLCPCIASLWDGVIVLCFCSLPSESLLLCFSEIRFSLFAFMAALAKVAQQQIAPVYSPCLRQYGGASRVSRRANCRKIHDSAARPLLPARYCGGSFAHSAFFNAVCNIEPKIVRFPPTGFTIMFSYLTDD
jgi:hypothetical protein